MKTAFLYAGQGSQRVGMGRDLYAASPAFRKAFDAAELDFDLHALCFDGPQETLNQTQYTQPCMVAFACGTAGGVLLAKLMNVLSGGKINPLIGSAGVSAVPMAARVSQKVGQAENPSNFLLMHAMGPNVAGVIGSAVAAGVFISMFG